MPSRKTAEPADKAQAPNFSRPLVPSDLIESCGIRPSPEMSEWIRQTFLDEGGPLSNEHHAHLRDASIGVLWHSRTLLKNSRQIIGRCELVTLTGDAWAQARKESQIHGWFGLLPDFIISIDAEWWSAASDREACALVEHELCHASQAVDGMGLPRFDADGNPVYAIRGHDVEEFIEVVRRYGPTDDGVRRLVDAASQTPLMSSDDIGWACGTCGKRS